MRPDTTPGVFILCPLAVEQRAIARALRSTDTAAIKLLATGPGPESVARAIDALLTTQPDADQSTLILAGLAGGLAPCDDLPDIGKVVDQRGACWRPTVKPRTPSPVTLLGLDAPVFTPEDKHRIARSTGAAIGDTESHAFARRCTEAGLDWTIVRAVSDRHDESLPIQAARWVNTRGETRTAAVLADALRSPRLIPQIIRLARRSATVLPLLANRVAELVESLRSRRRQDTDTSTPDPR